MLQLNSLNQQGSNMFLVMTQLQNLKHKDSWPVIEAIFLPFLTVFETVLDIERYKHISGVSI